MPKKPPATRYLVERAKPPDQWGKVEYEYKCKDGTWTDDLDRSDLVLRRKGTVVKVTYDERQQVEEVFGLTGGELSDKPWEYTSDPPPAEWGWCNASRSPGYHPWRGEGFVERGGLRRHLYTYDGVPEYASAEYRNIEGDYITVVMDELYGERETPWGYHRVARFASSGETTVERYEDDRTGEVYPEQVLYLGDGWGEVIYKRWEYCTEPEDEDEEWCERPLWEEFSEKQQTQKVRCWEKEHAPEHPHYVGSPIPPGVPNVTNCEVPYGYEVPYGFLEGIAGHHGGDCAHPETWWRWYFGNQNCPQDPDEWRYHGCHDNTHPILRFHVWVPVYSPSFKPDSLTAQYPEVRYREAPPSRQVSILVRNMAEHEAFKAAVRLADI